METMVLNATIRDSRGKEKCKKLRRNKRIPAVVYGKNSENLLIEIENGEIAKVFKAGRENSLLQVNIISENINEQSMVILKDVQRDCISRDILHADFHRVSMDEKIAITVPVHFEGTAIGVKEGGILEKDLREVEIECLPNNIPEYLSIDVSNLALGHNLHVSDITPVEGVQIISEKDTTVATVVKPKEEVVVTPESVAEGETLEAGAETEEEDGKEKSEPAKKESKGSKES